MIFIGGGKWYMLNRHISFDPLLPIGLDQINTLQLHFGILR